MQKDPRVDAYIAQAAPFAQPILKRMRDIAHRALPDAEEGIKWGMPHFLIKGKNVAGIAGFKAHCIFVVHGEGSKGHAMGQGGRITSLVQIPPEAELIAAMLGARDRIEKHGSATRGRGVVKPKPKPEIPVPDDFAALLADNARAQAAFDALAPSHRREYLEWITGAKREETRTRRIATTLEWLSEGKKRNWKYENC